MKIDNSKDFYKILGINENASQEDIKKAYRKLSLQWHPDKHTEEKKRKEAETKFAEINEANDVLSDPQKRQQYDQLRKFGGGFGFDPFMNSGFNPWDPFGRGFNMHVNRPQNVKRYYPAGTDINIKIRLDIEDIYNYDKPKIVSFNKQVRCDECNGVGGTGEAICSHCGGTGMFTERKQQGPVTIMNQSPCSHCGGTGKTISNKCEKCGGSGMKNTIAELDVNSEIDRNYIFGENKIITVIGRGNESRSSEMPNGNLNIMIQEDYNKNQYNVDISGNIYQYVNVKYYDCLLGNPTYTFVGCDKGYHSINLPKCTKEGTKIECTEMHGGKLGAKYFVIVHIEIPNELDNNEEYLLKCIKSFKEDSNILTDRQKRKITKNLTDIFEKSEK